MPPASDGSAADGTTVQPATSTGEAVPAATGIPAGPRATSSAPSAPRPVVQTPVIVQPVVTTTPAAAPEPESGTIAYGFLGVAVVIVGIAAYKLLSGGQNSSSVNACDQIQAELDAKKAEREVAWNAYTLQQSILESLKAKLQEKAEEKVAEVVGVGEAKKLYDDLKGKYDDAQTMLELLRTKSLSLDSDINRLDAAYKVCVAGGVVGGLKVSLPTIRTFRGTVVENSLSDTKVLKNVDIKKTWVDGSWTLHDVRLSPKEAASFGESLATGPWYTHFWEEGSDTTLVVFKNKTFTIQQSKPETWKDAVAYGKSIGIPEEQLDFMR